MPVSIVSNLASTYAQQAIKSRNEGMGVATQRLSSGQRVYSAGQDAAAMTVGTSLKIENASLKQAQLNVTGGVSMLQIADGALSEISNILTRMQSLALQASSGNIGDTERVIVDREFQALKLEVDRISKDTEFNGVFMLAGDAAFDVEGASAYAADGVSAIGFDRDKVSGDAVLRYSYDATSEVITLQRTDQGTAVQQSIDLTALLDNLSGTAGQIQAGQTLELDFNGIGVSLTLGSNFDRTADILPTVTDLTGASINATNLAFAPTATGMPVGVSTALQALGGAYNHATGALTLDLTSDGTDVDLAGIAGISFSVNGGAAGAMGAGVTGLPLGAAATLDIYVDDGAGGAIHLGQMTTDGISTTLAGTGSLVVPVGQGLVSADYQGISAGVSLQYMVGSGVVAGKDLVDIDIPAATAEALGLTDLDVTTTMKASDALVKVKDALTEMSSTRATIGAQQSRMESVARNLSVIYENNEVARSALLDADVSEEITSLTNDEAMMQVGISMLTQANRIPQMLLQMLRDG